MPNMTTCTKCGALYEAGSEEIANEPERLCDACQQDECVLCAKEGGEAFRDNPCPAFGFPVGVPCALRKANRDVVLWRGKAESWEASWNAAKKAHEAAEAELERVRGSCLRSDPEAVAYDKGYEECRRERDEARAEADKWAERAGRYSKEADELRAREARVRDTLIRRRDVASLGREKDRIRREVIQDVIDLLDTPVEPVRVTVEGLVAKGILATVDDGEYLLVPAKDRG